MNRVVLAMGVVVLLAGVAVFASGDADTVAAMDQPAAAARNPTGAPSHGGGRRFLVAIDRSASLTNQQQRDVRDFMSALGQSITYGDEVMVVAIMQEGTDSIREWKGLVAHPKRPESPSASDKRALESVRRSLASVATIFTDSAGMGAVRTTDILQTLSRLSNYVRASDRRPVQLILLSDMLNYSSALKMERVDQIPDVAWVERRRGDGLLPELPGVCVAAVGAEVGTPRGVKSRSFWMEYFTAAGATLRADNYRQTLPPEQISC